MKNIKKITATETYLVRQPVLRAGKPIESCHFDGDDLETTIHFGLFSNQELAGILSVFKKINPLFAAKEQVQVRGMAVLERYRKDGFGKSLLMHCENHCINQNTQLIWFNARATAIVFYEKMGYKKRGTPFEIDGIGTHVLMFKNI
jgi:predicted GNAT family N-acyltransferase